MSESVNLSALAFIFGVGAFAISLICVYAVIRKPKEREQEFQIDESENSSFFQYVNIWYVLNILGWIFLFISIAKFIQRFM